MLPYYEKVEEYSDISQRDMWEYRLNLSEEEVKRMVMHLWDLQDIYSDYYFFDENCSYNLMFLLDAARPSLGLTESHGLSVIPIDTVKEIEKKGLIVGVDYRPSKATKIRYMVSQLSDEHQNQALLIANGGSNPQDILNMDIPLEKKTRILDLSIEFIQYRYVKKEIDKKHYVSLFLKTLKTRSKLQVSSENLYQIPEPSHPETGHGSNRLGIGFGFSHSDFFEEFCYRPSYHCLLDNDPGYDQGAQIQFCNINLRHYYKEDKFVLNSLDLIDIVSLSPRDKFFRLNSWKAKTGLSQKYADIGGDHLIYRINTGGGFSYYRSAFGLYYGMIEADLIFGDSLDHSYAAGIGSSFGLKKKLLDIWTIYTELSLLYYALGDNHVTLKASLDQNFAISRNNSIVLEYSWNRSFDHDYNELVMMWNFYF